MRKEFSWHFEVESYLQNKCMWTFCIASDVRVCVFTKHQLLPVWLFCCICWYEWNAWCMSCWSLRTLGSILFIFYLLDIFVSLIYSAQLLVWNDHGDDGQSEKIYYSHLWLICKQSTGPCKTWSIPFSDLKIFVNSLRLSDTYVGWQPRPSLVQNMARPLSEPMLEYC